MKRGFAFVTMQGDGADVAISALRLESTAAGKHLRVEFSTGEGAHPSLRAKWVALLIHLCALTDQKRRREANRRKQAEASQSPTLFITNFDPERTEVAQLEEAFGKFGAMKRWSPLHQMSWRWV